MNHAITRSTVRCLVAAFLAACSLSNGDEAAQADEAQGTASQRVHPLLIRNDHNALIQVVVEVGQGDVHATSFTFSLRGTDDLRTAERN